ncbi:terpenoid synthase [Aspergillus steynii IBT 23096]|uniref:Terpene synthase n=1 Tax=Aspergillus steynii IBT 23096 TaxID=1392250 RepID=A0A2I2GM62_9EURO|nr:terpenoid synthase [Aspergillus steynii IBT 23096]PLB53967.1 terpenoid synthase [Aspergillus steynii IBT 23096]
MTQFIPANSPVASIIRQCKGQEIKIPDLLSLSPGWKPRINKSPDESVDTDLQEWQRRSITSKKILEINQKAGIVYFAKLGYPEAGLEELCVAAKYIGWLFAFDDALDYDEFKHMKPERKHYGNEAIKCITESLFCRDRQNFDPGKFDSSCPLIKGFYEIGYEIGQELKNKDLINYIYYYICEYINAAVKSVDYVDAGEIVDIDSYMEIRMHTSGAYPVLALCVFTDHIDLPRWILELDITQELMKHVNIMISIDNDMFSLKKEFDLGHLDSLVPLLVYKNSCSAQSGIDAATALIRTSFHEICRLENELYILVPDEHLSETRRLIQAWKDFRSALARWNYSAPRYFGKVFEGTQEVTATL